MGMTDHQGPRRLFDMEIDEISLVDRGANQHASIVFSKAFDPEEDGMDEDDLYDEYGELVEEVEVGDLVYDSEGNEYVVDIDDGTDDEDGDEDEGPFTDDVDVDDVDVYVDDEGRYYVDEGYGPEEVSMSDEGEYAEVGKGIFDTVTRVGGKYKGLFQRGMEAEKGVQAGKYKKLRGYADLSRPEQFAMNAGMRASAAGVKTKNVKQLKPWVAPVAAGTGGLALGAGGMYAMKKSLGDVVMEELSKAATEEERNDIVASAMDEVEIAKAEAAEAWDRVNEQDDAMLADAFISKAAEFNLPVDPVEFGLILKAASVVLDAEQLDMLENLFNGMGEVLYEELGYEGDTDNVSVMDVVDSYAGDYIGKAQNASHEMVSTAIFDMNPDAYDAYLAEQNGR